MGQVLCVLELGKLQQTMSVTSRPLADDPLPILVYRRGADGRLPILVSQLKKQQNQVAQETCWLSPRSA